MELPAIDIHRREVKIAFFALLLVLSFFVAKNLALYLLFTLITAVIVYYTKLYHFPVDISPLFFLQIVITRYYNLTWTVVFIVLGYVIPKVLAGSGMKWESYAFIGVSLLANMASLYMQNLDLLYVGFITSAIQYIGGIFIGAISKPFFLAAIDGVANVTNNLLWFLIFTDLVMLLL